MHGPDLQLLPPLAQVVENASGARATPPFAGKGAIAGEGPRGILNQARIIDSPFVSARMTMPFVDDREVPPSRGGDFLTGCGDSLLTDPADMVRKSIWH